MLESVRKTLEVSRYQPHRKCFAAPMGLFYIRVRRRVHFKL